VYWLQPPPYLRWAAAAVLVVGAFLWDLRGAAAEPHPFAARAISAGARLGADDIVWRRLPEGAFTVPDLSTAVAAVDLEAGEPISAAVLAGPIVVPDGWWAIPIDVSSHAGPGDEVLLIVVDPPLTLSGIVIEPQVGDATSLDHRPALVAVPGSQAPLVAAAAEARLLVTAVRP
ncbi:MAG: SAF domain-containing protein, partial [Actinomycetota bacterium]